MQQYSNISTYFWHSRTLYDLYINLDVCLHFTSALAEWTLHEKRRMSVNRIIVFIYLFFIITRSRLQKRRILSPLDKRCGDWCSEIHCSYVRKPGLFVSSWKSTIPGCVLSSTKSAKLETMACELWVTSAMFWLGPKLGGDTHLCVCFSDCR